MPRPAAAAAARAGRGRGHRRGLAADNRASAAGAGAAWSARDGPRLSDLPGQQALKPGPGLGPARGRPGRAAARGLSSLRLAARPAGADRTAGLSPSRPDGLGLGLGRLNLARAA